jgi:cell division protein FtsL
MRRVKMLLAPVLAIVVFGSAIEVVLMQHEARRLFVEIQEQNAISDELNIEWGRLQLEQSTWATDDRIEEAARTALGMHEPGAASLVLIAR